MLSAGLSVCGIAVMLVFNNWALRMVGAFFLLSDFFGKREGRTCAYRR